jgi:hypothetical protein
VQGESRLAKKLATALRAIGRQVARKLSGVHKAAEEEDKDPIASVDWTPLAEAAQAEMVDVATDGARRALVVFGVEDDASITEQVFKDAVAWAKARAAELVGKSWDDDGQLIDNPDAEMAISDTVREEIRAAVAQSLEEGESAADLADRIEGLGAFSAERAELIARTEIIRANANGQMEAMRSSGVVTKKGWSTSTEDTVCDECQENEDAGDVDIDEDFPSGDDCPPAHPACMCVVTAAIEENEGEAETADEEDAADEEAAE